MEKDKFLKLEPGDKVIYRTHKAVAEVEIAEPPKLNRASPPELIVVVKTTGRGFSRLRDGQPHRKGLQMAMLPEHLA